MLSQMRYSGVGLWEFVTTVQLWYEEHSICNWIKGPIDLCIKLLFFAIRDIVTTGAMKGQITILMCNLFISLVQCGVSEIQVAFLLLLFTKPLFFLQYFGPISAGLFTPDNIRYLASTLHSTANVQPRVIHFSPGGENDLLIEIPLGPQDPKTVYTITVGLNSSHPNTKEVDSDLAVGISDGTNDNVQLLVDVNNYHNQPPCYPINGSHDNVMVPRNTRVPAIFTLTFVPYRKYAVCETAQVGGYLNTGTFNTKLDPDKDVSLRVFRHDASEQVFIHYLKVETFV